MKQRNAWIYLLLVGVTCLTVLPFWAGRFYGTGDMRDVFIPLEHFFQSQELRGAIPSWDPNASWGFPVIAAAQIGFFYPPLLLLRLLPLTLYLPIIFSLHIALALFGMFFFMRRLGASTWASYLSAISFGLSSFIFEHATHLNIIMGISWLPLAMLVASWVASKAKISPLHIMTLAAVLGLPFLAGHLQMPLLIAIVSSIYFIYQRRLHNHKIAPSIFIVGFIALFAIAITAVQLLPTLELVQYSSRGLHGSFSTEQANQYSFPLYHLVTVLFPRFFSSGSTYWGKRIEIEYGFFIGTLPLLLAIYAAGQRFKQKKFFITLALGSFLLALGSLSPIRIIGIEPSLWFFSAPTRWLLFTTFSGAVMAGFGFDLVKTKADTFKKLVTIVAICVIGCVTLANAIMWLLPASSATYAYTTLNSIAPKLVAQRPAEYYVEKLNDLITIVRTSSVSLTSLYTIIPLAILIAIPLVIKRRWGMTVLLIATTAELILVSGTTSPTVPWPLLINPPSTINKLPDNVKQRQARIISIRKQGDTGKYLTNPATNANDQVRAEQRALLVPLVHDQFNIAGVEWPASLDLSAESLAVSSLRSSDSYNITDIEGARSMNIESVLSPSNSKNDAVNIENIGAFPRASLITKDGEIPAEYTEMSPTKIQIKSSATTTSLLVVRDSWYPGWQTYIDGQKVTTNVYENIFRSASVPAGVHTITMEYVPYSMYIGVAISLIAVTIITLSVGSYLIR